MGRNEKHCCLDVAHMKILLLADLRFHVGTKRRKMSDLYEVLRYTRTLTVKAHILTGTIVKTAAQN